MGKKNSGLFSLSTVFKLSGSTQKVTQTTDYLLPGVKARPISLMICLVIPFFMISADFSAIKMTKVRLAEFFNVDISGLAWISNAYYIPYTLFLLLAGFLGARFGGKKITLLGIGVFMLSGVIAPFATNLNLLLIMRICQGIGSALIAPQSMLIITQSFKKQYRGLANFPWPIANGLSIAIGHVAGGVIVSNFRHSILNAFGWQAVFLINIPLGLIVGILSYIFLPNLKQLGITPKKNKQNRLSNPLTKIPKLLKYKNLLLACFICMLNAFIGAGLSECVLYWAQTTAGWPASWTAWLFVPFAVVPIIFSIPIGLVSVRRNSKPMLQIGLIIDFFALLLCSVIILSNISPAFITIPSLFLGLGSVLKTTSLFKLASFELTDELLGTASGLYSFTSQLGYIIRTIILANVMNALLSINYGQVTSGVAVGKTIEQWQKPLFGTAMAQTIWFLMGIIVFMLILTVFGRSNKETN